MSDTLEQAATTAAQSDAAAETAAPTQAAPGQVTQTEAQGYDDSADFAAALAELTGTEPATKQADAPVAQPAAPVATPVPAAKPADDDMKAIMAKLARLEYERDQATEREAARVKELEDARSIAADWSAAKSNPVEALKKLGYTQDQVLDFVTNGPRAKHPEDAAREAKLAEFEARVAKAEKLAQDVASQRAQEQHQVNLDRYIATIPAAVKGAADKFPTLLSYYDGSEQEMAQHLYSFSQEQLKSDKNYTLGQAAAAMEAQLVKQRERLLKGSAGKSTQAAPKATLTNAAPVSGSKPSGNDLDDESLLNAALAALKG